MSSKRSKGQPLKTIGGIPDPIMISERVAVELFAGTGMTRHALRTLISSGEISPRTVTINGREHTGLLYQELVLWAQSLPLVPPNE